MYLFHCLRRLFLEAGAAGDAGTEVGGFVVRTDFA
jgi:hypothetical protein